MRARGRVIAGIDPGTQVAGFARVVAPPAGVRGPASVVEARALDLGSGTRPIRLGSLAVEVERWLLATRPRVVVVELAHVGPHPGAGLAVAEARGVILGVCGLLDVAVAQYRPAEIKQAITGRGNAAKPAVRAELVARHGLDPELPLDASDALALALTHALRLG